MTCITSWCLLITWRANNGARGWLDGFVTGQIQCFCQLSGSFRSSTVRFPSWCCQKVSYKLQWVCFNIILYYILQLLLLTNTWSSTWTQSCRTNILSPCSKHLWLHAFLFVFILKCIINVHIGDWCWSSHLALGRKIYKSIINISLSERADIGWWSMHPQHKRRPAIWTPE